MNSHWGKWGHFCITTSTNVFYTFLYLYFFSRVKSRRCPHMPQYAPNLNFIFIHLTEHEMPPSLPQYARIYRLESIRVMADVPRRIVNKFVLQSDTFINRFRLPGRWMNRVCGLHAGNRRVQISTEP